MSEQAVGFVDAPLLTKEAHARSWRTVTDALHYVGSTVVCQLWHTGRMSHSSFHDGAQIVGPSAIAVSEKVHNVPACGVQGADGAWYSHETPRALTTSEVEAVVASFGNAAALAKVAGFDGVEIHAASGYLIDSFLQSSSNVREDKYGGDADGRFTILAEVLAAVSASFPLSRIGVKFSPNNGFNGMGGSEAKATFLHAAARCSAMGIGYLHVVDGVGQMQGSTWYGRIDSTGFHGHGTPLTLSELRNVYKGSLIGNGGYVRAVLVTRPFCMS